MENTKKANSVLAVFLVICCLVLTLTILPVHGEEAVYDSVIRLHVLANSDSEADQALKLLVRDAILARTEDLLDDCQTRAEAEELLEGSLQEIAEVAAETLRAAGSGQGVRVTLGFEEYPTKRYEKLAFPAGEYLSLRVFLGEGEGQNWWCVLFPPLCLSAASATEEQALLSAGLSEEQYRIITDTDSTKYKLRFKILELAEEWF